MRLLEVLDFGVKELEACSSDPKMESFVFLEETTGKNKEEIIINNDNIDEERFLKFKSYLRRRVNGEPWQYIVGKTNFLGFDIFTQKEVFIPRPETEVMTVRAIDRLKEIVNPYVIEIGCGTGAISISIASKIKESRVIATDISKIAVRLCNRNVIYNKLSDRISVVNVDLFECFGKYNQFDMIISNPPYVLKKNLSQIDSVVEEEPLLALDGGHNGVDIINKILKSASLFLKIGGLVFIEIDSSNLPYIKVPDNIKFSYEKDQYSKIRFFCGVKL